MTENTITITLDEYRELLKKAERIAAVERMLTITKYVSMDDVKIVLGIGKEDGENA